MADGVGEAVHAEEGSALATEHVAENLEGYLDSVDSIEKETAAAALGAAFKSARKAVESKADDRDATPADYATTLLAVVGGPNGIAGAAAGDGGIVYGNDDTCAKLFPREEEVVDLEETHYTYPLTHDEWDQYYRFGFEETYEHVAAFTDGLSQWAWDGAGANNDWYKSAMNLVTEADDTAAATATLESALSNENYQESKDDKTLVLGWAASDEPPEPAADEPRTDDERVGTITDIEETGRIVTLLIRTPEGEDVDYKLYRLPVRDANCRLDMLLAAYSLPQTDINQLVGRSVPLVGADTSDRIGIDWAELGTRTENSGARAPGPTETDP